jgi:hypothetical protein
MTDKFCFQAKRELCEALGVDIKQVYSLKLEMEGQSVPTVTVRMYVTDDKMRLVGEVLKKFQPTEEWELPLEK